MMWIRGPNATHVIRNGERDTLVNDEWLMNEQVSERSDRRTKDTYQNLSERRVHGAAPQVAVVCHLIDTLWPVHSKLTHFWYNTGVNSNLLVKWKCYSINWSRNLNETILYVANTNRRQFFETSCSGCERWGRKFLLLW